MKKGQIWVETVIYTLIILVIISVLLSILKPVIDSKKDQILLQQSLDMLNQINNAVEDVKYYGNGNTVPIELQIKKGELKINPLNEEILFTLRSNYQFSEENETIKKGKINITTTEKIKEYEVIFKLKFSNINITWENTDNERVINPSPNIYKIYITNMGRNASSSDPIRIDINM